MNQQDEVIDAVLKRLFQEAFRCTTEWEEVMRQHCTSETLRERQAWIDFDRNLETARRRLRQALRWTQRSA